MANQANIAMQNQGSIPNNSGSMNNKGSLNRVIKQTGSSLNLNEPDININMANGNGFGAVNGQGNGHNNGHNLGQTALAADSIHLKVDEFEGHKGLNKGALQNNGIMQSVIPDGWKSSCSSFSESS